MEMKLFAAALAASVALAAPVFAEESTSANVTVKCDWSMSNCDTSGSATYSNSNTYGSHTQTQTLTIGADKDGPEVTGGYKDTDND